MLKIYVSLLAIITAMALVGCGSGSSSSTGGGSKVQVALNQTSVSVGANGTTQFTATVTGTGNTAVTWSVDGVVGGNATAGTITAAGMYTAPSQAGTHTVTATSAASPTVTASAQVTVTASTSVSVSVAPSTATVLTSATIQFTATVQGSSNTAVTWSVDTVGGGNSTVGTISASGLYTAPSQAGTHTITATSQADTTKSATATVTVNGVVTVSVSPTTATILVSASTQFTATVHGTTNTAVTWSVDGVAGGSSSVGMINASGLYTAPSLAGTHTVTATSVADTTKSASATVTVDANNGLAVSPATTTVVPRGTQQFTTTVAVTWSVDGISGGNSSVGTITSGGNYTAPFAIGAHTITATSTANSSTTGTASLTVINSSPRAVLTYHNDDTRQGAYTEETVLTPANVKAATFGKVFSYTVDGQIYTQPLYIPQVNIGGTNHEVVYVATEQDTVFAFDAKGLQSAPLWSKSLGTPVPKNDVEGVSPVLGITSTPVIDITTGTMYVLAEATGGSVSPFKLHALDIATGAEKFGGPVYVTGSVPGTGWDQVNGTITLESSCYQRMGLALNPFNNMIEIAFGHCNHGWVVAYNKTTLQQSAIFNDTPDGAGGGLWAGGGAPAINDVTGELYIITGTDAPDPPSGYNDAFLRLSENNLSVMDFFQPDDNLSLLIPNDADLGSGSNILMPDNSSGTPHETIGGGKDGNVFVVNRDDMGSFSTTSNNVIQTLQTGTKQFDNIFSTPAYWNGTLYYHSESDVLHAYSWSAGELTKLTAQGSAFFQVHGATTSISANGNSNGIVWEIDNTSIGTGPAVLHATDASNVNNELYNSSQSGTHDQAGIALKFTVPTIAGGRVFVPTANELDIYGLL
jgi:hypothetical protein